jgi:hypothetical protein
MQPDSGPGPAPFEPAQPEFRVSAVSLVSRTFSLWSRKMSSYIVISSIAGIGLTGVEAVIFYVFLGWSGLMSIGTAATDPWSYLYSIFTSGTLSEFLLVMGVLMIAEMVAYAVIGGAMTKLALDNYGSPTSGSTGESLSFSWGRFPTLVGIEIVFTLLIFVISLPLVAMSPAIQTIDPYDPNSLSVLGTFFVVFIISFVVLAYVSIRFAPRVAVVVASDLSVGGSIKRTFSLTSRSFWHIFGGWLLLTISIGLLGTIITVFLSFFTDVIFRIAYTVLTVLLLNPLGYIFQAVLYKDLMSRAGAKSEQQWW